MNASEERFCPSVLIPWVFALVALIGCNALVPNPALVRKGKDVDGSCLTQVSGEALAKGAQPHAKQNLAPGTCGRLQVAVPSWDCAGFDARESPDAVRRGRGAVQGRAPPVPGHC